MIHPNNKFQRRLLETNKFKTTDEKKAQAKEHSGKVWRKLTKERLQEQETEDELRTYVNGQRLPE